MGAKSKASGSFNRRQDLQSEAGRKVHLLGRWCLEYLDPSGQGISFHGWGLQASALNPLEDHILRG